MNLCQRHSSFAFGWVQNGLIYYFQSCSHPHFEAVPEHPGKLAKVPDLTALLTIWAVDSLSNCDLRCFLSSRLHPFAFFRAAPSNCRLASF